MGKFDICGVIMILCCYIHFHCNCQELPSLQNLDESCLKCMCYTATHCNLTLDCYENPAYCGPYKISKLYWLDAMNVTLPEDDYRRWGAFQDCARHYKCAQQIVINYMIKYAQDCNDDGVTNCDDYIMIHYNGGLNCHKPLDLEVEGRNWIERHKLYCEAQPMAIDDE